MSNSYKIDLGISLNQGDLGKIKTQLNNFQNQKKIKLEINRKNIDNQLNSIRKQIQNLSNIKIDLGGNGGNSSLSLNTEGLDASLKEIVTSIKAIKKTIGTIDDGGEMKSLLSSINQISTALDKVNTQLNALSKKDFKFNFGLNMGKSASQVASEQGDLRRDAISQLKQQAKALEDYFDQYYKVAQKGAGVAKLTQGTNVFRDYWELSPNIGDTKASLKQQVATYKQYIDLMKQAAKIKGVDLSSVTSGFSKTTDDIVKETKSATNNVEQLTQAFKGLFGSGIDGEKLSTQLDSIVTDLKAIKTVIQGLSQNNTINSLTQSFNKLSETLDKLMTNARLVQDVLSGVDSGANTSVGDGLEQQAQQSQQAAKEIQQAAKQTTDAYNQISKGASTLSNLDSLSLKDDIDEADKLAAAFNKLKNIQGNIKKIDIGNLDTSKGVQELKILEKQLESLSAEYNETVADINEKGGVSATQFQSVQNEIKNTELKLEQLKTELREDIKLKINGDITKNIQRVHSDFDKLSVKTDKLKQKLDLLDKIKVDLDTASVNNDLEGLKTGYQNYLRVLKDVKTQIDINKQAERDAAASAKLEDDRILFHNKIDSWLTKNSAATKQFGARLREMQAEVKNCDRQTLNRLEAELKQIDKAAEGAGKKTKTFADSLKGQFAKYSSYFSVASLFMYASQGLRSMFEQVKLIDSAMTELKKVTNETDEAYNKFLTNAADRAREIGTTIDGLVSSTADFARLGYGFEDAQGLAEVANIYAVVGDEINGVEGATESLISTMAAFKNEMNGMSNTEFAMSIIDKFNEIGNNFAISSGGIGEALERSASSLMAANNTIDESIALITAANTVVQDPDAVGTAFKTISMRIRGAKTELEEAGLETDGMVESTAKLRSEILALTGVDIMENANEFKSTYKIMDELAAKWKDLTDIQQATVTELIAGKRQGNIVSSLMTNFDTARDALETSMNSAGSAMKEHEKWQQSLEAQILKLKASWQGLSQAFLKSDFLHGALKGVIGLVDGLTKLIDTVGTLPTLLGTVAAGFSLFKNKGLFTFDKKAKSIQLLGTQLTGLKGKYTQMQTAISRYNSLSSKSASFQENYIRVMNKSSTSMGKYLSGLKGAKASFGGYIGSLVGATAKTIALEAVTIALNAALTMGISFAIQAIITAIDKWIVTSDELAEKVDEIISKFEEEHNALQKLKGDYDTSNESSMISKYEKLSKGVDNLGRNVSLTTDEYSEYQNIVNQIAEQIPSLVSGYDEQGNALLSCKGNVEELTKAYENLIKAQNNEVFKNVEDIGKDFKNSIKESESTGFWGTRLNTDAAEILKKVLNNDYNKNEIEMLLNDTLLGSSIGNTLQEYGIEDVSEWSTHGKIAKVLAKTAKTNPEILQDIIENFETELEATTEGMKSIAQATLSDAFDISSSDYYDMSDTMKSIAQNIVNSFDYEFYKQFQDNPLGVKTYINDMLDQIKTLESGEGAKIEATFDLQTQFNGGEISYGEYVKGLEDTGKTIDELVSSGKLDKEIGTQIKLSIGLDEEGLVDEYQRLRKRLASEEYFDMMPSDYVPFIEGLTSEELSVVWKIIPELEETDYKETIEDVKSALRLEMMLQGLTFDLNLEVETAGIEALNTALAESVSATGLSSDSITALKSRYADLEAKGYDLSVLFEETSHGIHLNRQEFNKLEKAYATDKLADVNGDLEEMKTTYDDLGETIKNTDDPVRKAELYNDRQTLAKRISEAATLAAQYEGLTSAYNDWLAAEEAGQERDMYENVIEGFENIGDEISRGWYDDGTIEFLEMLTGRTDLAGKSAKELKKIYDDLDKSIKYIDKNGKVLEDTGYSVRDFFTVDDEGNSTADGVYNFLDAIGKLEEEAFGGKDIVKRDKNGKPISFDFELAGGDEAIAEALGVSEELVQIMKRAADDAGFVVSLDGTYKQLADLQNEARESAEYLKSIGKTDFEFDFNSTNLTNLNKQLEEAHKILDDKDFWNKDGTFNFDADGATEAMQIVSTLQAKIDQLTEEQYGIGLTVEDEKFEEPLENLQEYGRTVQTLNQLKLNPKANTEEIKELEGDLEEISKYFANLDEDLKVELGFEADDNWEEVQKKIESGEVTIPTVLDIQANMDKNIEKLVGLSMLGSDLYSKEEKEVIKKQYGLEVDVEVDKVDTSDVEDKVESAVIDGLGNPILSRKTNIEIIAETFGIEDVDGLSSKLEGLDDKTIQAIAHAIGQGNVEALDLAIAGMDDNTVQAIAEALGYSDVETLKAAVANMRGNEVDAKVNTDGQAQKVWSLQDVIDGLKGKTVDIITNIKKVYTTIASGGKKKAAQRTGADPAGNDSEVNGTAHVNGTVGRAYKQGSWGTKDSGTALVGELGREVLVRDGRYYTIGDNGAEFIKYKKGDIIFNHVQSEQLFKNGKVTADGGRARAFANGTAFAQGTAFANGTDNEIFDGIEILIKRFERAIDTFEQAANNVHKSWEYRDKALSNEIDEVGKEIDAQKQAQSIYETKANSVDLDEIWKEKIREGTLDIETINNNNTAIGDESLSDKIAEYQKWYELSLDASDAIKDLEQTEAELYEQRFENVQSQYDSILQGFEHTESMLDEYISQAEAKGHIVSKEYYEALIDNEKQNISTLKQEQTALIAARDQAVEDGKIAKYSEAWYDMCSEIDGVTQAIEEGTTALIEYDNAMRDIDWEVFDLIQERISDVVEETNFLIELMSYDKLFDDNGKLTDKGMATMGLHGQNYNAYMYQADDYGAKVKEIDDKIASGELDGYSKDVIDKRREYLEAQREAILNAEQEKESIKDLVEEGINLELDALQELIDKKNEELESEKDLYEYQKKVKEQTEEIASLEKQMAAYSGDNSEEARAKVQELKVSLEEAKTNLEETEYDKYLSDTQQMLDTLYDEYELTLNTRLDDVDGLISQVIEGVNAAAGALGADGTITSALGADGAIATALGTNATTIKTTLENEVRSVGTSLSTAMSNIWNAEGSGNKVITMYGQGFQQQQTTTNTVLNGIKASVDRMVDDVDKDATTKVNSNKTTTSAKKNPTKTSTTTTKPTTINKSSGGDGKPEIGDKVKFISGKYYYDSEGKTPLGSKNHGKYVYITNVNNKKWATHPIHISTGRKLGSGDLGWLKKNQISGYATGKKNFLNNEVAWTQENGKEFIVRPSDGAILTPIAKGDSVLNAQASGNIWDMANSPAEFIKDNLNLGVANVPNGSNTQNNITQNLDKVVFHLPNVKNYDELVSSLQKDPKFDKLIKAMTIDQIAGKSSLAKNKSIR